jgi:uncharacterized protein (DUF2126 family)
MERHLRSGRQVDAEFVESNVRLTMGGEPTFVSIDDMEADEWNTLRSGQRSFAFHRNCCIACTRNMLPSAFCITDRAKWYPGESLPRWAFTCYWRTDGLPLWHDPQLLADPGRDYGFGLDEAQRFATELSRYLTLDPEYLVTAYEDPLVYVLKERDLPVNLDPLDNKLDSEEDRERMRRVFERGLGEPVGYVFPLRRGYGKNGPQWQSGIWMLRARHLFLAPGDSPVGFRLPLDRLPWEPAEQIQRPRQIDPMAPSSPLAVPARKQRKLQRVVNAVLPASEGVVRTALIVEPRNGRLYVFFPPLGHDGGLHRSSCGS